jgi:succinyl-CoA synthetase beta subunit
MDIRGHTVHTVLVESAAAIKEELYFGIVLDRARRRAVAMASREGGMDIEEVAASTPDAIVKLDIDPLLGLRDWQARELAFGIGLEGALVGEFVSIALAVAEMYARLDATLVEINPLVVTEAGGLLALDAKMTVDDSALFRQAEIATLREHDDEPGAERDAREAGLNYVELDGTIGCLVNGAGLAMATMDVIKLFGGEPANFLDIGGGAQAAKVEAAMRIILRDPKVTAVLINIFGGITRGDEVARGLLAALERIETQVPIVARIVGTNAAEARQILADASLLTAPTLAEAAQLAVRASGGEEAAVAN